MKSEHVPGAVSKPLLTPEVIAASIEDPCFYVEEVLGQRLHSFLPEFLAMIRDVDEIAVRSGNGVGKSFVLGLAANWCLDCGTKMGPNGYPECKVLVTAPTDRQVQSTYRYFKAFRQGAKFELPGICMEQAFCRMPDKPNYFGQFFTAKNGASFAGPHSPRMFVFIEEAGGVPEEIFAGVVGCAVGEDDRIIHLGNPWASGGTFAGLWKNAGVELRGQKAGPFRVYKNPRPAGGTLALATISALDSPNVKSGRDLVPGLVSAKSVARLMQRFGRQSDVYRVRVLGLPPRQDASSVVPIGAWETAKLRGERFADEKHPVVGRLRLGLDLGGGGEGDASAFVERDDVRIRRCRTWNDSLPISKEVARAWLIENPDGVLAGDMGGLGRQMFQELEEEFGGRVVGVVFNSSQVSDAEEDYLTPSFSDAADRIPLYANRRAELWHKGGKWLETTGELDSTIDRDLLNELEEEVLCPKWDTKGRRREKGQLLVEPKDETRKRLGRSPNLGDALMLCVAADYSESVEMASAPTAGQFYRDMRDFQTARGGAAPGGFARRH